MNIQQKLDYLQTNFLGEWLKIRQEVENELSDRQTMFCICGRLATGFHERGCRKFQKKVAIETVKRLDNLLLKEVKK
jgi:hypothetical protein